MEFKFMVTLTIDGIQVEVPDGTTVLEAAEKVGIKVPRLCHHPSLKPYGGCRLCMVEVEGARILQPSCTLPTSNNMVVRTNTPKVQEARKFVLSMLFSERNHFCMYCQATDGDCELQCAAYQQSLTHWPLTPNYSPYAVDASHKYIFVDNNRCILCRRCVRACGDLVGNFTLGFEERGANSFLVADYGVPLGESTCISCGACVQICPTGALMDRRSAYQGRESDLTPVVSVCSECSIGCQRNVLTRNNRLVRIDGVWNSEPGEGLLCEKGRYMPLESKAERLSVPEILRDGKRVAVTWEAALTEAAQHLRAAADEAALFASAKLPIESLAALKSAFTGGLRSANLLLSDDNEAALASVKLAEELHGPFEAKLEALKHVDVALLIGSDLENDNQVAGFFLKRQVLENSRIISITTRQKPLIARSALRIQQKKGSSFDLVNGLVSAWHSLLHEGDKFAEENIAHLEEKTGIKSAEILRAVTMLKDAQHPVVVLGGEFASLEHYDALVRLVLFCRQNNFPVLIIKEQANSLAAAQLGYTTAADGKKVKAAFVALGDAEPTEALLKHCAGIPLLVVSAAHPSALTERAAVVLPCAAWAEEGGSYLSTEGRLQQKLAALDAPESVKTSAAVADALVQALNARGGQDWKTALKQQPSPVDLDF
mgnify:CR=1 FL=1